MKILLPDPHAQARAEAETINAKREMVLNLRINRILADCLCTGYRPRAHFHQQHG